jgi:hypothetical protein
MQKRKTKKPRQVMLGAERGESGQKKDKKTKIKKRGKKEKRKEREGVKKRPCSNFTRTHHSSP